MTCHALQSALIAVLLLLAVAPGLGAEEIPYDYNYGTGPLNIRQTSPGQSVRLTLPNVVPGTIRPGWAFNLGASTANVWLNEEEYLMDYEILDLKLDVSYGFNKRFGVFGFLDRREFYGGILDGFIDTFHEVFGIDGDGREQWPKNETLVILYDDQHQPVYRTSNVDDEYANTGIGLALQYLLTRGGPAWIPAVSITGLVRYGLETPSSPQAPWDYALQLGASKRLNSAWFLYAALGYTFFNQTKFDQLPYALSDRAYSGMLAVSWNIKPHLPVLLQYQFHEGTVKKNLGTMGQPAHEITLGFKWLMDHGSTIEFGMTENFGVVSNSADFGIHLGYDYRF